MSEYTAYNTSTGKILATGMCADGLEGLQYTGANSAVLIGTSGNYLTQYVSAGALTARPIISASIDKENIQADGFDVVTIIGIPTGWTYEISNGVTGTTVGGNIEFAALEQGTFIVRFTNWPYQDIEFTINAFAYPVDSPSTPVGTPLYLHSNSSVTVAILKETAKHEIHILDDLFLARELEFAGSSRQTFEAKATEATAYAAAAYPTPIDSDTYPYIAMEAEVTGQTGAQVADAIIELNIRYQAVIKITERSRLSAFNDIDINGLLETVARKQFQWRHAFSMSSIMDVTLNKAYVTPAPDPNYSTVEVLGNSLDELAITLPEKSLPSDMEVVVEAYAPPGDPWRGAYYQLYTNPGASLTLTFADPTDPAYAASDIKWLVTIRNLPRVSFSFIVDSTTA